MLTGPLSGRGLSMMAAWRALSSRGQIIGIFLAFGAISPAIGYDTPGAEHVVGILGPLVGNDAARKTMSAASSTANSVPSMKLGEISLEESQGRIPFRVAVRGNPSQWGMIAKRRVQALE